MILVYDSILPKFGIFKQKSLYFEQDLQFIYSFKLYRRFLKEMVYLVKFGKWYFK